MPTRPLLAFGMMISMLALTACSGASSRNSAEGADETVEARPQAPVAEVTQRGFRYGVQFLRSDSAVSLAGQPVAPPGTKYVTFAVQITNLQGDRPAPGPRGLGSIATPPENGTVYDTRGFLGASKRCRVGGNGDARLSSSELVPSTGKPLISGIPDGWCTFDPELSNGTPQTQLAPNGTTTQIFYIPDVFEENFDASVLHIFAPTDDRTTTYGGYLEVPRI